MKLLLAFAPFGLASCCVLAPAPDPRFELDPARLSDEAREIYDRPTLALELEPKFVSASREMVSFLMEEAPFASACVRALGKGNYTVERAGEVTRIDDLEGLVVDLKTLYVDEVRWVYWGDVKYRTGLFGEVHAKAVFVIAGTPEANSLKMQMRAFLRIETFLGLMAKLVPGLFASAMRQKSGVWVDSAKWIAEACQTDARGFHEKMKAAAEVDQATLEKFRQAFIR